jgi:hypothetical protein
MAARIGYPTQETRASVNDQIARAEKFLDER